MIYLSTAFDYNKMRPLITAIYDGESVMFVNLYQKGLDTSLNEVEENKDLIRKVFNSKTVVCNDFKAHLECFNMELELKYNVYDVKPSGSIAHKDTESTKKELLKDIMAFKEAGTPIWSKIVAEASVVYQYLQNKGVKYFHKVEHPVFRLDTYTGRTRSLGFSIHNKTAKYPIKHIDYTHNTFVHFDLVSADIRCGGILSGDEELMKVYENSDPYTFIADLAQIDREVVKSEFLPALYRLDFEDPTLAFFPGFSKWIKDLSDSAASDGVDTLLGRKFFIDSKHDIKSVVNSALQGSVAQVMQCIMIKIFKIDRNILMTDIYDSVVCASPRSAASDIVREVGKIVYNPMECILDSNPTFPYKVSVGLEWCRWEHLKTVH